MDFGAGDVIAALKVIKFIYDNGFTEDTSATVQYRNFENDIRGFEELLINLRDSIENARQRYNRVALPPRGTYNPVSEPFQAERRSFVGDFESTLKECRDLLERKKRFLNRRSNPVDNLLYNVSGESETIEELRRRIHMHSIKVKLAIDRLSINLLTDVDSKVDELLDIAQRNLRLTDDVRHELHLFYAQFLGVHAGQEPLPSLLPPDMHVAGSSIQEIFSSNLYVNAPKTFNEEIPMVEGFDILLVHYEFSINGSDQTPERYLALLKARWLVEKIQASQAYLSACPGFYHKRAVNQIEFALKSRVHERNLIAFEERELLELPAVEFLIWPPPPETKAPVTDFMAVRGGETEVLRVPLNTGGASGPNMLSVFCKSQTGMYRVTWEGMHHDGRPAIFNLPVHADSDRLIPRYALPTLLDQRHEIAIFSRGEENLFTFRSHEELLQFQTAITGYQVPYEQKGIKCQFSQAIEDLDCESNIQIWQDPIQLNSELFDAETVSYGRSFRTSTSFSASSSNSRGFTPSIAMGSTVQRTLDGWEADKIRLPALVIFKQVAGIEAGKAFQILHIELGADFGIDPRECNCRKAYDECAILCLKRKSDKAFPVRVSSSALDVEGYPDPNSFNLLSFQQQKKQSSASGGSANAGGGSGGGKVETKDTKYLLLRFPSLAKKKAFHAELNKRFALIDKQFEQRTQTQREFQHRDARTVQKQQQQQTQQQQASMSRRPSEATARPTSGRPISWNNNAMNRAATVSTTITDGGTLSPRSFGGGAGAKGYDMRADFPPAVSLAAAQSRGPKAGPNATPAHAWAQEQFQQEVFETEWIVSQRYPSRNGRNRPASPPGYQQEFGGGFASGNRVVTMTAPKSSGVKKLMGRLALG